MVLQLVESVKDGIMELALLIGGPEDRRPFSQMVISSGGEREPMQRSHRKQKSVFFAWR